METDNMEKEGSLSMEIEGTPHEVLLRVRLRRRVLHRAAPKPLRQLRQEPLRLRGRPPAAGPPSSAAGGSTRWEKNSSTCILLRHVIESGVVVYRV